MDGGGDGGGTFHLFAFFFTLIPTNLEESPLLYARTPHTHKGIQYLYLQRLVSFIFKYIFIHLVDVKLHLIVVFIFSARGSPGVWRILSSTYGIQ